MINAVEEKKGYSNDTQISTDLFRSRYRGLRILLYGARGRDKASTALEAAENIHRPVLRISGPELGQSASKLEEILSEILRLAYRWKCVLILDHVDYFIKSRTRCDLVRSNCVSVFLRLVENHRGILFFTTNASVEIDMAFKNRLHTSIYYPPLDQQASLKIWDIIMQQVIDKNPSLMIDREANLGFARKHYANLPKSARSSWSGRDIKNVFQTALAIVESESKAQK